MWKGSTCFFVQYQIHVLSVYFQYQEQVNSFTRLVCIFSVPRTSEQLQERDRYIEGCKWKTSQQVCGYKILWLCLVISLLLKTLYLSFINKYFSLNSVQWHLRKRDILNISIDFKWCSNIVTHLRNL